MKACQKLFVNYFTEKIDAEKIQCCEVNEDEDLSEMLRLNNVNNVNNVREWGRIMSGIIH
jgi:hypothetical protein